MGRYKDIERETEREREKVELYLEWRAWRSRLPKGLETIEKMLKLEESLDVFITIPSTTPLGFKKRNPYVILLNECVCVCVGIFPVIEE